MHMVVARRRLLEVSGVAALLGAVPVRAADPEAVTLQIDGAAVPYYAPIYVAVEKGFFAARGIQLELIYAAASDIMRNVAAGNVGFGFPNGDSVIAARAAGLPVSVVHTTYQRGIGALLALEATGIRSYADLKGRKVAVTALGSPNYLQLRVGLSKAGLQLRDVTVEVIATGAIMQSLQAGQVDAVVFSELRRYPLEAAGTKLTVLSSNDFLPSFGNVLVTSDATVTNRPGTVHRFIEALDEGLRFTIDHPQDAIALSIEKHAPTFRGQDGDILRAVQDAFVPTIWQSALTRQNGFGAADMAAWQRCIDTLAEFKVVSRGFPAPQMVRQPSDIRG